MRRRAFIGHLRAIHNQRLVGLPLGVIPEAADNPWFKRVVREAPGDSGL